MDTEAQLEVLADDLANGRITAEQYTAKLQALLDDVGRGPAPAGNLETVDADSGSAAAQAEIKEAVQRALAM